MLSPNSAEERDGRPSGGVWSRVGALSYLFKESRNRPEGRSATLCFGVPRCRRNDRTDPVA